MHTRIRHFRKQRGFTQGELAAQLATTAATVSRLETADMTISMDWLERIASVLGVSVPDLLDAPSPGRVACLGEVRRGGVLPLAESSALPVSLGSAAREPLAFKVMEQMGAYSAGDILVADRLSPEKAVAALGHDCFAADAGGYGFGRFISFAAGHCVLVPPEPGALAREFLRPGWIAPVVTLVRHFPAVRMPRSGN
ncbi:transcriptional regulator, XRE family [Parvibaculum lavamentivorans DS-1]|uniref:Transcriptional regulator, XRE family n=1 Tax=Parvibaculum lavamentivorans (strain DS-1 / DSM 13023 / NCIMB 13966) TaxID=402881 RepID=A7HRG4_PARL1|nr:helix-turn-helix transcriptional regulator [Parvibaculum lavamentivorans]ABS62497.1 transcriptional regulator, XRE family [Parvibaculum lavamentivorans DS-1]